MDYFITNSFRPPILFEHKRLKTGCDGELSEINLLNTDPRFKIGS